MMTDPIADMLTRIRNASAVKKEEVGIPFSKVKFEIAEILAKGKWVKRVEVISEPIKQIRIELLYDKNRKPRILNLVRVSTPGRRVYVGYREIPKVLNNLGIAILSTPEGMMTNIEAKKRHLGGELLCEVS